MKHRIAQVKFVGKWVEVWFGDKYVEGSGYSKCCKGYMLVDLVEQADLEHRVMNHGYVGLWITGLTHTGNPTKIEVDETAKD